MTPRITFWEVEAVVELVKQALAKLGINAHIRRWGDGLPYNFRVLMEPDAYPREFDLHIMHDRVEFTRYARSYVGYGNMEVDFYKGVVLLAAPNFDELIKVAFERVQNGPAEP